MDKKERTLLELAEVMDRNGVSHFGIDSDHCGESMYIEFKGGDFILFDDFLNANDLRKKAAEYEQD